MFNDRFEIPLGFGAPGHATSYLESSSPWDRRARSRKASMDKYLWNQDKGMYFDYNTSSATQSTFESATTFFALWSGAASPRQALALVARGLPRLERPGGLSSTSEACMAGVGAASGEPPKQWDYPFGWAPHQILAWDGLRRYGFEEDAQRLAYRWLHMVTEVVRDYNGAIVEKYDVANPRLAHKVEAEYGNQGLDFEGLSREG